LKVNKVSLIFERSHQYSASDDKSSGKPIEINFDQLFSKGFKFKIKHDEDAKKYHSTQQNKF
jgi:hypothetical protein